MEIRVFRGSVLDAPADAIVNAANTELRHGGGVAAAIARAAGPDFERASRAAGWCPLGEAVDTAAGRLPFRCVLHVPTVDYRAGGRTASAAQLSSGVAAALRIAKQRGCTTVALPILGAGVAGVPAEQACRRIADGLRQAEAAGDAPAAVFICAFTAADGRAAAAVFGAGEQPQG